ncbi:outer membrane lipoprotein-sorting protein [Gracilibacillus massiliensis]|uniref:outer membrane lipoprotein-sorting protein n=1 Tax=Gracilibacillus massiliensis TaxID=1564956 RepID=UPI00071DD9BF|nr:outer membrane lipoprotein-sorting protein [Gracilibacillus massiliensis]
MKNSWKMLLVLSFGLLLAACSTEGFDQYSPDQIVAKAVEVTDDINGYYTKNQLVVYKGEEKIDDSILEQWTDKENNRIKTISETANGDISMSVNDGEEIIHYSSLQEEAYTMEALDPNDTLIGQSPREEVENTLKLIRETHDIEVVGNEEINGFDTHHIKATPKEEGTIRGTEEYWIDKENWFIIRTVSQNDDITVDYTVTDLEINPSFETSTFTIDLPDGVDVKPIEEMDLTEETTIAELVEVYDQPILTSKDYKLYGIDKYEMEEFDRTEANQEFIKDDILQFTLTSFEAPEEAASLGFGEGENLEVRGLSATYTDDVIQNLVWDEEGIRYSILSNNPEFTKEDLIKIAENLEFVEE